MTEQTPTTFGPATLTGTGGSHLDIPAGSVFTPSTVVVTPPVDPPVEPPDDGGRVRFLWHHGWSGPPIASWPSDVLTAITAVGLDMCQSAAPGTGRLTDPPRTTPAECRYLVTAGIDVYAGVGGSGDGGISLVSSTNVDQMLMSLMSLRDRYGITGGILDLEGAPGDGWTPGAATDLGNRVIGAGMKFAICSSTWAGRMAGWGQVAHSLGAKLDHWQRMFYDFPEANDSRLSEITTKDFATMRTYLTRDAQLVAAWMPKPVEPYPNASPVAVLAAAYKAGRARYGDAGWAVFETKIEAATGWKATRALAKL